MPRRSQPTTREDFERGVSGSTANSEVKRILTGGSGNSGNRSSDKKKKKSKSN